MISAPWGARVDTNFEQARLLFLAGVRAFEAGRPGEAERQFAAALALVPGRPSVLTNLGAVRLNLGRAAEALDLLEEALAQEPDNAEALRHRGAALAELRRPADALAAFDAALRLDPRPPSVWTMRGSVLQEMGRREEAAASFREAQARGGDAELLAYYLAGLEGAPAPAHAPRHYVQALFDGYAGEFEAHVVRDLHYEAPRALLERVAAAGRRHRHALDLGCGTGLCGRALRALAERVTGVDLSPRMLERSAALGVYDDLRQADIAEFLAGSQEKFDLVVAADVFIYVGALDEVFALLARRMDAGGTFCFTVEEALGEDLELRASLRYAHSEASIGRLAREHGFAVKTVERRAVREEQRQPIAGLFFWLERA